MKPRTRAPAAIPTLRDAAAAASAGGASDAAHLALAAGGSAIDAVVAGYFAAAGADEGVLLGPCAAIVANAGSGVRAFDGRSLQPGKGAGRPRGFTDDQAVPDAARIAVPRSVPMLFLLHAYGGRSNLSALARYGAEAATDAGAKERAKVLRRVGAAGVIGLRTEGVHEALLLAANPVAGGSLTEIDLDSVLPADADGRVLFEAGGDAVVTAWPWCGDGAGEDDAAWTVDTIVAADSRGGVAALAYAHQAKSIQLAAVELSAPRLAVPVRRGVTRVAPGAVLRSPAPIAVARFGRDLALALGLSGAWQRGEPPLFPGDLDVKPLGALGAGQPVEAALGELARSHRAARCVAAVRAPKATRPVVVVPGAAAPILEASDG